MKSIITKILIFSLCMFVFSGCGKKEIEYENPVSVYYINPDETKVEMHLYDLKATEKKDQVLELVDALAMIPSKLEYKAPLQMGFIVNSVNISNTNIVILNMNKDYLKMPATTEVLVRAAVVRTLTQIEGIDYVEFLVAGDALYDNAGEVVGRMKADRFIDNDGNAINTYELAKIKLYFADETGEKLNVVYREKRYSTNTSIERFVVDELILGPTADTPGAFQSINSQTKVISVITKDGICYVNLDTMFLSPVENVNPNVSLYSIVDSLVELSNVTKVSILINGETIPGETQSVYERNLDIVNSGEIKEGQ